MEHPYRTNTYDAARREPCGYALSSLALGIVWTAILVAVSHESLRELPASIAVVGAVALLLPHAVVIVASLGRLATRE